MEVWGAGHHREMGVPAEQNESHSTGGRPFPRDSWRRVDMLAHAIQQQKSTEGRSHFSFLLWGRELLDLISALGPFGFALSQ